MKWQILCLTQPSRKEMFEQLSAEFARQFRELGWPKVDLLAHSFDPSIDLGANRNALKAKATAEYVSYFDDDDFPEHDYVSTILPLLDGTDYIGHKIQCWCSHLKYQEYGDTDHSLRYTGWSREGMRFLRDISHVNPMRRELAMQADFDGGFGEDARWAARIRDLGIVKTEHYIPRVMYHYIWRAIKRDETDYSDPYRLRIMDRVKSGSWASCTCGRHCDGMICGSNSESKP